jgi:hypothetical protein
MATSDSGLATVVTLLRQLIQSVNGLTSAVSAQAIQGALSTSAPTATAGSATLPSHPVGFIVITDTSGTVRKIPYYAD